MKNTIVFILLTFQFSMSAQIISEIMYDPPESGSDSLEYLEIYNNTGADLDLEGFSMIGVTHTFTSVTPIAAEQYVVISIDSAALSNVFGVASRQWEAGALNNGGEDIGIINPEGDTIFWMEYSSTAPWPSGNYGIAIELCDLESDYTEATNWNLAQDIEFSSIDARVTVGSPGRANKSTCQERDYRDLVINEVLYEQPSWDPDFQYLEFFNHGDKTINLAAWSLSGSLNFPLFGNVHIGPGEYLIMTNSVPTLAPFIQPPDVILTFNLPILGEPDFVLRNPNGEEVMNFQYGQGVEFPIAQRGEAVQLCDPTSDPTDGNNWAIPVNELTNADGNSIKGTPLVVNNCEPSSLIDLTDLAKEFKVVPHPVTRSFRIETENAYEYLQLVDQYGRILTQQSANSEIDVEGIPAGAYVLRIFTSEGFVTKKLVKI